MVARRLLTFVIAATLGMIGHVGPASAATKQFSMVVSPASVVGDQTTTFSVSLTNGSDHQPLGSADISVPSEFTGVSVADPAGPATATSEGSVVHLRDAGIPPGGTITIFVTSHVPCPTQTYAWSVVASKTANFHGQLLTLDQTTSSLTTSVSGCTAPAQPSAA